MNIENFPFNELLGKEKGKVKMHVLIQKIRTYLSKKMKRNITNKMTSEDAKLVMGIAKVYVELGCVEENIVEVYADDYWNTVHWNALFRY